MSVFSENLKKIRLRLGLNQFDFARLIGLDITKEKIATRISNWENDRGVPEIETLIKIAEVGKVSLDTLLKNNIESNDYTYAVQEEELIFSVREPEFAIVADVPAGRYEVNHHDYPEYIKLDIDPRDHFALKVDKEYGISMSPYIEPGDILFCSYTRKFSNGDIVVARYDGTKGAVKRIFINEQITLISFNPIEEPIIISKKQLQQVFKVVLIWKRK